MPETRATREGREVGAELATSGPGADALPGAWTAVLLRAAIEPTLILDGRGLLRDASESALLLLGMGRDALLGRSLRELVAPEQRPLYDAALGERTAALAASERGPAPRLELRGAAGEGLPCELRFGFARGAQGEPLVVAVLRDLRELERARAAEACVRAAVERLSASAAELAHELKNPITALHMAMRAAAGSLGIDEREVLADFARRLEQVESALRRTLGLVRRLEPRRAVLEARELLAAARRKLLAEGERRGVALEVAPGGEGLELAVDRSLFSDVLLNLAQNALEAARPGGRVLLGCERGPAGVLIVVEDDGPGVPEEELATLFEPRPSRKPAGSGLGLPYCKRVVELHGGSIRHERPAGGGARFLIEIPSREVR